MTTRWFVGLAVFLLSAAVSANIQCRNTDKCACFPSQNGEYEYQCPPTYSEDGGIVMHIWETDEKIEIDCYDIDTFDIELLPSINATGITKVSIRFCPLPENSFAEVLQKLSVTEPSSLQFRFSDLSNATLTKRYFKDLSSLKSLSLWSNSLRDLAEDVFANTPNLESIDLKKNNIILKPALFQYTANLHSLDISGNDIQVLPAGLFRNLNKLNVLHMWNNKIKILDETTFEGLDNLTSLELTVNKIEYVADNTFANLSQLVNVSLSINQLSDIPAGLFARNFQLEQVRLEHNLNLKLPDYAFAGLPKLKEVRLFNCNLQSIPAHVFNGSAALASLKLDRNRLQKLPEELFRGLTELRELNLGNNQLESLPNLRGLKKLQKLLLDHNALDAIDKTSLQDLTDLLELRLEHNSIKSIDQSALSNNKRLVKIDLSHNQYNFVETASYLYAESPFNKCTELEEINLSHNLITDIKDDLTLNKVRLRTLDLSHNFIEAIQVTALQTVARDKVSINLGSNNITNIDFNLARPLVYHNMMDSNSTNSYSIVHLDHNPIKCDCYSYDLVRYFRYELDPTLRTLIELKADNLLCAEPKDLKDVEVEKVMPTMLSCPLDELDRNYDCPDGCGCSWKPYDTSLVYDCAYRNLSRLPEIAQPKMRMKYNQTQVFLQGNRLEEGPKRNLIGWESVTKLYLSENRIRHLTWLPSKLEVLTLDRNNLSRISQKVLEYMNSSTLQQISLDHNPWTCDCKAENLTNFVRQHSRLIETANVRCGDSSHKLLIDLNRHNLCKQFETLYLILISIVAITLMLCAIAAALYYRHQEDLKVWLYAHNMCLWWVTEEELDKNKKYDAFISFSHKDEDFVSDKLLPKLEGGSQPFKLCIHSRDWIGGEMIVDQIVRSVYDSRRTIVLLSSNFLESVWGKMEFRTAHTQAMSEGRARVIIILLGDIDIDALDDDLKTYLRTNTYVKWDEHDRWFWDKLLFALPHSKRGSSRQKLANMMTKIDDKFSLVQPVVSTPDAESTPPVLTLDPIMLKKHPLTFMPNERPTEAGSLLVSS